MTILSICDGWELPQRKQNKILKIKGKNYNALYHWLNTADLSQSDKIKSGHDIENFIKYLVKNSPYQAEIFTDYIIETLNGCREADLLFKIDNTIHYREIKGNVNLDSEKKKANFDKINSINCALKAKYPNMNIDSKFLCVPWFESDQNIEGFNDFIKLLGFFSSFEEFVALGEKIGNKIRNSL